MENQSSKSKQVFKYLYRYALEKGASEVIEAVVPYGKIGMILWEVGHNIYEILNSASDQDRAMLLGEVQGLSEAEIERLSEELSQDPTVINAMDISEQERRLVARGIYQSLRAIPNQRVNPQQLIQGINHSLFRGNAVLSIQDIHSGSQGLGSAVVRTLLNGNGINQRQTTAFSQRYPEINGFEIKGFLGEGAYARVYLAKERLSNGRERICALKVGILESQERFEREVKNMKLIQHPYVLSCWNTGIFQQGGISQYWISMPNMGGITLESLILGGRLDLETKLLILMQMVEGLTALHEKGIVHRDLKPSNCLISSDFELKISDFGLSKDMNNDIDSSRSRNADAIGTPAYMSPEQIDGQNIGYAADIWSFGVIAYELLSGDLPWGREIKPLVLIGKIQHVDIDMKKLEQAKVPKALLQIIEKCLKRDSANRYTAAKALRSALLPVAKEERNRVRHDRFKDSWRILLGRHLIENFVMLSIQGGESEFRLEKFLSQPEVFSLSLVLDTERLGDVLKELSQIAVSLGLSQSIKERISDRQRQQTLQQLKTEKEQGIKEVNLEMERVFASISPSEMNQRMDELSERKKNGLKLVEERFKKEEEQLFKLIQARELRFDQSVKSLRDGLNALLSNEIKDFDQMKADQKAKEERDRLAQEKAEKERIAKEEQDRLKRKNRLQFLMIVGLISLLIGGISIYAWHENRLEAERMAEQRRLETERMAEQRRLEAERMAEQRRLEAERMAEQRRLEAERMAEQRRLEEQLEKSICEQNNDICRNYKMSGLKLVHISGGSFMMGSDNEQPVQSDNEQPVHHVNVKDFYMSKTEVTVGQYRKCVEAGVCSEPGNYCSRSNWSSSVGSRENHPINCVDWRQARAFAKWVGGDLPSEAQWEYAARSRGRYIKYPWGNEYASCKYAVMMDDGGDGCGQGETWGVCSKTGDNTAQGLCDMGGNVSEWVLDEYHNSYSGAPADDSGWCSDRGCSSNTSAFRVFRGGSWPGDASILRSANRNYYSPDNRAGYLGFRVSRSVN